MARQPAATGGGAAGETGDVAESGGIHVATAMYTLARALNIHGHVLHGHVVQHVFWELVQHCHAHVKLRH